MWIAFIPLCSSSARSYCLQPDWKSHRAFADHNGNWRGRHVIRINQATIPATQKSLLNISKGVHKRESSWTPFFCSIKRSWLSTPRPHYLSVIVYANDLVAPAANLVLASLFINSTSYPQCQANPQMVLGKGTADPKLPWSMYRSNGSHVNSGKLNV